MSDLDHVYMKKNLFFSEPGESCITSNLCLQKSEKVVYIHLKKYLNIGVYVYIYTYS